MIRAYDEDLVDKLAALAEDDFLASVVATATIAADGTLGRVHDQGLRAKLDGIIQTGVFPIIGYCLLARAQEEVLHDPQYRMHRDGLAIPQLLDSSSFTDLIAQLHARLQGREGVQAIDYWNALKEHYATYVQREDWLFDKVLERLGTPQDSDECPYRVLVTPPGVGKTAFALEFIRRYRQAPFGDWILGAWHVLRRVHPWNSAKTIAGQLELRLRRNLACPLSTTERARPIDSHNASEVLIKAIDEAAARAEKHSRGLLLLVDGLDEAFGQNADRGDLETALFDLFHPSPELPRNVRVLFTSREGKYLDRWLHLRREARTIKLTEEPGARDAIERDIRVVLERETRSPALALGTAEGKRQQLIDDMVVASRGSAKGEGVLGVFLVARWFADQAKDPKRFHAWVERKEPLPIGIEGMVDDEWRNKGARFGAKDPGKRALFEVIVATLALWDQEGLAGDQRAVRALIEEAGAFRAEGLEDEPPEYVNTLPRAVLARRDWVGEILNGIEDWFESAKAYRFHHARISEVLLDPEKTFFSPELLADLHHLLAWRCRQQDESWDKRTRVIALTLGPWHGLKCENIAEQKRARDLLTNDAYLRDLQESLGTQAITAIERSLQVLWERGSIAEVFGILDMLEARTWSSEPENRIRFIGRRFIERVAKIDRDVIRRLTGKQAEAIVGYCMSHYETEPLNEVLTEVAVHLAELRTDPDGAWVAIRKRILSSCDFVAKYALAKAENVAFPGEDRNARKMRFVEWLNGADPTYQELGGYALRYCYSENNPDVDALMQMSRNSNYLVRSALGELLLDCSLRGEWPHGLNWADLDHRFREPVFDFNLLDVLDILALRREEAGKVSSDKLGATRKFYLELDRDIAKVGEMRGLSGLAEAYWKLGMDPQQLNDDFQAAIQDACEKSREDEAPDDKSAEAFELVFCLLLRHPLWECSEAAASLLANWYGRGRDKEDLKCVQVIALLKKLLAERTSSEHAPNWRLVAGAIEATFALRHAVKEPFDLAVRNFHGPAHNPRVRGLVAENVVAILIEEHDVSARAELLRSWSEALQSWLTDDDAWICEHMYRLGRELVDLKSPQCDRNVRQFVLDQDRYSPLLAGSPPFWELGRNDFLRRLGRAARVRLAVDGEEARSVWEIDNQAFGDAILWSLGKEWFCAYPQGLFVMMDRGECVAYMSVWPLDSASNYEEFVAGRVTEKELRIRAPVGGANPSYWYIGSIWGRNRWATGCIVRGAFARWSAALAKGAKASVCAVGHSPQGTTLLKRSGFMTAGHCIGSGYPIYQRTFDANRPMLR